VRRRRWWWTRTRPGLTRHELQALLAAARYVDGELGEWGPSRLGFSVSDWRALEDAVVCLEAELGEG
jgi:hypothetical protein